MTGPALSSPQRSGARARSAGRKRAWAWWALDAGLVVVFAATGRASHDESTGLAGVAATVWPFLAGMSLGWAVVAVLRRRPATSVRDGAWVWLATVAGGMALRAASGAGVALSFVLVALAVTGVLLLGWRLLAALAARRSGPATPAYR
ncbi:MAG TPA: DUF3054 domain-containing protein [Dermatophilaceae bacterium]|nr:DUF3054 domain-containing protein [Dermatophilaceae bacterium]